MVKKVDTVKSQPQDDVLRVNNEFVIGRVLRVDEVKQRAITLAVPAWLLAGATPVEAIQAGMQAWLDGPAERGLPLVMSKD